MKKFLAVMLSIVLAFAVSVPAFAAQEEKFTVAESLGAALKEGGGYPIVFVTGIGQTFSYFLDENADREMYFKGQKYNYTTNSNIFLLDTTFVDVISDTFGKITDGKATREEIIKAFNLLKNNKFLLNALGTAEARQNFVKLIGELVSSITTGNYTIEYDALRLLARSILHDNIIDENGKLPDYILSPVHECPVSEYEVNPDGTENKAFGKGRFYTDIPCREIIEEIGEDKVFCYNYAPFGYLTNIADGLDHLINDVILGENGYFPDAEKVVLIPMSMGGAMVSQYLYNCEKAGKDPHVARVVSIVGCWDGSDIMADLIERKYVENSAELFYTKWPVITGDDTTGILLNNLWRLFRHDALSRLVTDALGAICDELVLKSPSMLALIPDYRYEAIREKYLTRPGYEEVLRQLDTYHEVQTGLKDRMAMLNSTYGTEFYFLSGYDLDLGGGYEAYTTSRDNYAFFGFLYSANKVNSDEIIPIQSTAPGTTWVKAGEKFSDEYINNAIQNGTDKYIDTFSQSIDLSTAYYPDHVWTFHKQVHQLDNNNTALTLAFRIANGEINSVNDCKETFPQFNDSRDLRLINRNTEWVEDNLKAIEEKGGVELLDEANAYLRRADEIRETTVNNRDEEEKFSADLADFCTYAQKVIEGKSTEPEEEEKPLIDTDKLLKDFDAFMFEKLGYYGFADTIINFLKSTLKNIISVFKTVFKA